MKTEILEEKINGLLAEARKKFRLGRICVSRRAGELFGANFEGALAIFARMARLDFGELEREDCLYNLQDICAGMGRIIGVYRAPNGEKLWCITQLCGAQTYSTIILPEDY